jgi:hypothetical protein
MRLIIERLIDAGSILSIYLLSQVGGVWAGLLAALLASAWALLAYWQGLNYKWRAASKESAA